jgi:hypothetical protein
LTNNSNVPQNVVYTVTPTSGSCAGSSFSLTVTVNPNPEIPDLTDTICSGSVFNNSPANGGATIVPTGTTYTWTVADDTNITGESNQASAQASIAQNLVNLTNVPQSVVYTVTPRSGAAGNCIGDSFTVTVTVNPSPQIQAQTETVCSGNAFTVTPANGGITIVPSGTAYTWTVVDNPNVTGESTQTSAQLSISQTLTNTSSAPQTVIYTVTPQSGTAGSCAGSPFTVRVSVNPTPSLNSTVTPADICSNATFTYTPTSAVSGATFSWTRAAVAGISNPEITTGQISNPNEVLVNSTTSPIDVVYTYVISANGCNNIQEVRVRVKPDPTLSSTLTPTEICGNSTFTYTPTSGVSGTTFTWTRAAVAGISNPRVITPQTSNPNETLINTSTSAVNVVYTFIITANGCSNTQNVTVQVNPRPTLSSSLNPAAICSSTAFTYTPSNTNASATFTWTRAVVAGISNPAVTTSQATNPNEVLVNTTPNLIDVIYAYTVTSNGCSNTENVRVTVKPNPVLSSTLTPPAICSGAEFNYAPTTATSGTTITWTRTAIAGISNPAITSAQSANPKEILINSSVNPIDVVYVFSLNANGCNATQNVTVRVNPTATLNSTLTPAAICSNTAFTYTPNSLTSGATFAWTRTTVAGISSGAGSGNGNINETLVNTTSSPINVVYVVNTSANGCSSPASVVVRVDPRPEIGQNVTRLLFDICSGDSFSFNPEDGVDGIVPAGTTYSWVVTNENGNLSGSSDGSGTSISGSISNSDTRRRTADYLVTPSYGGCNGAPFTVRIRVQPEPSVNPISSPAAVCNGATVGPFTFSGSPVSLPNGNPTTTVYNWTNNNPSIGLSASGTGDIPSFNTINNGVSPVSANVTVTPFANGCNGPSQTFTITVNPTPKVTVIPDYCVAGGRVQLIANSNVAGTTWLWNTGQTASSIFVDLSGSYTVTATAPNGCTTIENISVAQELVLNGGFTAGNIVDPAGITGFNTGYMYLQDLPGVNNELIPDEGTRGYGIGTNANNYHPNFWGIDHTNNSVGPRNMMIVNGKGGNLILWEQTVIVEPNTDYYFSAWAMSVNPASPARLQFAIVGPNGIPVPVGTIAELGASPTNATQAAANNYWQRFYSDPLWNSGNISGPIKIRIINLNPALGGNDFAIDDISFGTLSTFINLTSGIGTDDQTVCQDSPITDITYTAGSGIFGPTVTGLPTGITPVWNGVTLRFTGSPTQSGIFNYTITTTGACAPATATGRITVRSTPTAGVIAANQTICAGEDPIAFTSATAGTGQTGSSIIYRWESNTNLTNPNWTVVTSQIGATYNPPIISSTTQYRRITLATLGGLTCESVPTAPVTVTLQNTPTSGSIATDQAICNGGDPVLFTSTVAGSGDGPISYRWESAVSPYASWTNIGGANSATYDAPSGLTATTQYRRVTISTLNGTACESAPTAPTQVTVNLLPTSGSIAAAQTICIGGDPAAFGSTVGGTGSGSLFYRWEIAVSPFSSWSTITGASSATYDAPSGLTVTTQYRRATIATLNGVTCESGTTAPIQVTVQSVPNAGAIATAQTICSGGDPAAITSTTAGTGDGAITYLWESTDSPFTSWSTISGANSAAYDAPSGLTVTTQYRRITISTLSSVACQAISAPVQVTIAPDNTVTPVNPNPSLCLNTVSPVIVIHNTTGATGIAPQSATVNYNLPNGVIPSLVGNELRVEGTPSEFGVFNYIIPLTGGCGSVSATGTITVENPTYPIIAINVVNPPTSATAPFSSTFTVYSNELASGTYTINYSIDGVNGGANQTIPISVTTPGEFTFFSLPYSNEGTTLLTINWIKKDAENCTYYPPNNNTAVYGFGCSTEFLQTAGVDAFYVPADVYQVRIEAYEGASLVDSETMTVIPGGVINIGISDAVIFATEVSLASATMTDWLVSATGTNSRLIFYFDCNPQVQPCPGLPPYQYIDSEGYTVIRFDVGACVWNAPDGLDEFEVLITGGGGGGGFGDAAGGGGGGAVVYQHYIGITMNGFPGLQGAVFPLSVGARGAGSPSGSILARSGEGSTFQGPAFEYTGSSTFTNLSTSGGGRGGSTSNNPANRQGVAVGASGGGGAAYLANAAVGGAGNATGNQGGRAYANTFGAAGAGGGGVTLAGEPGASAAGGAEMFGGNGGSGITYDISGEDIHYGAGGGGTSSGATSNYAGTGGSPYTANSNSFFGGGNGTNNGVGLSGTTYGSGGGAGRLGGGSSFPGVIYIRYPNFRILSVEYLYFNVVYNSPLRAGDLSWSTAKEWENDQFEIERSVNNVKTWEKIGEIKGAGYSDGPIEYDFRDSKLPLAGGNIFYRLKQVDFDSESTYSDIKSIQVEAIPGTTYWRVYPNPTSGDPINMEMLDAAIYNDELVTVRLISATGVFDEIVGNSPSQLSTRLSEVLRGKAASVYTIEIAWGVNREYHKVILRR